MSPAQTALHQESPPPSWLAQSFFCDLESDCDVVFLSYHHLTPSFPKKSLQINLLGSWETERREEGGRGGHPFSMLSGFSIEAGMFTQVLSAAGGFFVSGSLMLEVLV